MLDLSLIFKNSIPKTPEKYLIMPIFQLHDQILNYCFENTEADEDELCDFIAYLRTLKKHFKNLEVARRNAIK